MAMILLPGEKEIDVFTNDVYDDFDIVTKNEIVITNERKYNRLIHDLKNFREYILDGTNTNFLEGTGGKIDILGENNGILYRRNSTGVEAVKDNEVIARYINPLANLTRLISLDNKYDSYYRRCYGFKKDRADSLVYDDSFISLSDLISGSDEDVMEMINYLRKRDITLNNKKKKLLEEFREFGTFSIKALDCINIELIAQYSKNDLALRLVRINEYISELEGKDSKRDLEHLSLYREEANDINTILKASEKASENYKVLTLAKKINQVLKK